MNSGKRILKINLPIEPMCQKETLFANGHAYTPAEKREYMKKCAKLLEKHSGYFLGCRYLFIKFVFILPRPKKVPAGSWITNLDWLNQDKEFYKNSRPDLDNYPKAIQDSMSWHVIQKGKGNRDDITGAGVIDDDQFIVRQLTEKIYCSRNTKPRIEITIKEIEQPTYERKIKSRTSNHDASRSSEYHLESD